MGYPILSRVLARIYRHVSDMSWPALASIVIVHFAVGWLGFALAGEAASGVEIFWYYYAVTVTTIGYGDFSPATLPGRLVAVFWIMPGGIAAFTAIIAKFVQTIAQKWSSRMRGEADYSDETDHIVILGWNPVRTPRLVRLFLADKRYDCGGIVLVASDVDRNPLPDDVRFVRANLPSADALRRSGASGARVVVAMGSTDNETLTLGLAVGALPDTPRIVAHFQDEAVAELLRSHCPTAECSVSLSIEMLARSAQDPGSSEVQRQIVSPLDSPTQFSLVVPEGTAPFLYGMAFDALKRDHDATLVAFHPLGGLIAVNAPRTAMVGAGDSLYVISERRILPSDVQWRALLAA